METDVNQVKSKLDAKDEFLLLDCRTESERAIASIEPSKLIPIDQLTERVAELGDPNKDLIVYCHVGGRSLMVTQWLRQQGFTKAQSMAGGIDAWSLQIDPSCPRY